jgi:hypothetical protein
MVRRILALVVSFALAVPAGATAESLREAAEKAGRELAQAKNEVETRNRARLWSGIGLVAGGGVLAALGSVELGDDESGPDDGEDLDGSDDGEDSDGWGNKALIGGGIAAAALGGVLLFTARKSGPAVSIRPGKVSVRHTIRF